MRSKRVSLRKADRPISGTSIDHHAESTAMPHVQSRGSFLSGWRVFGASHQGLDHLRRRLPCQDAFECGAHEHLIWMVVADGLGGELLSDFGAQFAVNHISAMIRRLVVAQSGPTEKDIVRMIGGCRERLISEADAQHCDPREFSATLQLAILDTRDGLAYYAAVGNGHCVVSLHTKQCLVLGDQRDRPSIGTAHLLHEHSDRYTYVETLPLDHIDGIFIFTDGLDELFLKRRTPANVGRRANVGDVTTLKEMISKAEDETRGVFVVNTLVAAQQHEKTLTDDKTLVMMIRSADTFSLPHHSFSIDTISQESASHLSEDDPELSPVPDSMASIGHPASRTIASINRFHNSALTIWLPWLQTLFLIAIFAFLVVDRVDIAKYMNRLSIWLKMQKFL